MGTFSSYFRQLGLFLTFSRSVGFCHNVTLLDNAAMSFRHLFLMPEEDAAPSAPNPRHKNLHHHHYRDTDRSRKAKCRGVPCDCIELKSVRAESGSSPFDSPDYVRLATRCPCARALSLVLVNPGLTRVRHSGQNRAY